MSPVDEGKARQILLRAAEIVRAGWCQKAAARNAFGDIVVSTAPTPPHILPAEKPFAPVAFDVTGAIFRAAARPTMPKGMKKEDAKLLYRSVWPADRQAWALATRMFCRAAGAMHPSDWNDRVCKSSEEAAAMLERAAISSIIGDGAGL